jgi:DNA-binding CsgD family transcriptional regulator/PAS domain-containing protein
MKPATHRPISEPSARTGPFDDQTLSDLIGDVYDAALDQRLWPDVLDRAADFVGGVGATLFSKDAAAQLGDIHYAVGIEQRYKQLYLDKYVTLDPTTTGQFFAEVEEPVATADLIPYEQFTETRFYQEWVRPQGLVDFVTAILDKSATSVAMFGVFRHERNGVVDDESRRRMKLIVPHIRRAALIGRMFDLKAAEAATFEDTLDGLSAGMYLVDAEGRIVHANAAGHAMLAAGDILCVVGGRLVAYDAQVSRTLEDIFAAAGQGDAALGLKGIAIPLIAKGDERYVGHVLPLTSGTRRNAGIAATAAAALFIRKAALVTSSPPEVIAKAFKLTPTELRVLLAIVEVGGVPEVAAALGVADTTVKTHVGRLFEKTGAKRQADLVKLVAGYATPLAS